MLFNTRNYIHLIDRNGKYVEGFPLKLPAEASSPLSVFDYENDREYRLILACKNKKIYNYALNGKLHEGFVPVRTESEVKLAVQYVVVGLSQFLVAVDAEGKIYGFSRKGVPRLELKNRTVSNCAAFYLDASTSINKTYLVYLDDKNNLINKISFSDTKIISKINTEVQNAQVFFDLADENRSVDMIITNDRSVKAYDLLGNSIFEKEIEGVLTESSMYQDESNTRIFSLSQEENKLFIHDLINDQSKTLEASRLPLISDLFKDNKKYLILPNGSALNCIMMN